MILVARPPSDHGWRGNSFSKPERIPHCGTGRRVHVRQAVRSASESAQQLDRDHRARQPGGTRRFNRTTIANTPTISIFFLRRIHSASRRASPSTTACDTRITDRPATSAPDKDALLQLGSGATMNEQLAGATLVTPTSGSEQLFGTDNWTSPFAWELPTICSAPDAPCFAAASAPSTTGLSTTSGRICGATITC